MHKTTRRMFLVNMGGSATAPVLLAQSPSGDRKVAPAGPASKYTPKVCAAFARRKGEYGLGWPGAIWDGEAARKRYGQDLAAAAKNLGVELIARPEPIYSGEEADTWLKES